MTEPDTPARIARMPEVTAMAAIDTIDLLADRMRLLLAHGRRMTLIGRWIDDEGTPAVETGLTMRGELEVRRTHAGIVVVAYLSPSMARTVGFSACYGTEDTEAQGWQRYHQPAGDRHGLTRITMSGGLPGLGPAATDRIVIRHWGPSRCRETVVAFDNDTQPVMTALAHAKLLAMAEEWPLALPMRERLLDVAKLLGKQ